MAGIFDDTITTMSEAADTLGKSRDFILELQAQNERLSRLLYEEEREHRNDRQVDAEYIDRLKAQIAELS